MSSPFKMNPGRGPMLRTGRGIPDSLCSPAQQQFKNQDAITGEQIPKNAKFSETTSTKNDDGTTTYSRNYNVKGTDGGPGGKKPQMEPKKWKEFIKTNPDWTPPTNGTKGINGTQSWRSLKVDKVPMAPIKPIPTKRDTPEIVGKRAKRTLTPPTSNPSREKTTTIGKIKKEAKKLGNYITPDYKTPKRNLCKDAGGGLSQ